MQIKKLSINQYKSITDPVKIENFSNLHILVGPNNAGKTNVLDAIHLFFDPEPDSERFLDKDSDIEISLSFNEENYSFRNTGGVFQGDGEKIKDAQSRFARIKGSDSSIYSLIPEKLKEFKENHPRDYQLFSNSLREYFKDVEISEELFVLSVRADHANRPIRRMGEGFKRLFVILFYIFHPQYDIILIDEPEMHLHPSIIRKFLLILAEKKLNNQIFLTTHHPTFVQADYLKYIWRVTRNENESTSIYGFPDKKVNIDRFVQEINDDNSGMLFSDKVLLVEGVSDYIFMREILKKFYKKDKEVKVVYCGGKGSIDIYSELCEYFKIPYAVMLDRDALNSFSLQRVKKHPKIKENLPDNEKIKILKEKEIFILEKKLEDVFPRKYKRKETKPLTSLYVSRKITERDLNDKKMSLIKDILDKI